MTLGKFKDVDDHEGLKDVVFMTDTAMQQREEGRDLCIVSAARGEWWISPSWRTVANRTPLPCAFCRARRELSFAYLIVVCLLVVKKLGPFGVLGIPIWEMKLYF